MSDSGTLLVLGIHLLWLGLLVAACLCATLGGCARAARWVCGLLHGLCRRREAHGHVR